MAYTVKLSLIAVLLTIFHLSLSFAHGPTADDEKSEGVGLIFGDASPNNGVYGENHGGYGFLNTSEAEAGAAFQFSCSAQAQREYFGAACSRVFDATVSPTAIVTDSMRAMALGKLREQALEYYYLQIRAAKTAQGQAAPAPTRPTCIPANSPVWARVSANTFTPGTQFDAKREAVEESLHGPNLAKALLYTERLEKGIQDNHCRDTSPGELDDKCTSLQYTKYRMQNSYPALWKYSLQGQGNGARRLDVASETDAASGLKDTMAALIGARGAAPGTTLAAAKTRGEGFIALAAKDGSSSHPGAANITEYKDIEDRFDQALAAAQTAPAGSLLANALNDYNAALGVVQDDHATEMQREMNDICANPPAATDPLLATNNTTQSIFDLAVMRPNIVRQALVDMSEPMRSLAKGVLCDSGAMPNIRRQPQCKGVSGGPLPGATPVNIDRWKTNDFPYGSQNTFNIARPATPANAPYEVNLSVSMEVGADLNGTDKNHNGIPDEMECKVKAWQQDVNGYLNCSTGTVPSIVAAQNDDVSCSGSGSSGAASAAITPALGSGLPQNCPMNPGMTRTPNVHYNIQLKPVVKNAHHPNPKPVVKIHKCFRAELGETATCNQVKTFGINQCIAASASYKANCLTQPGMNEAKCNKKIKDQCTTNAETELASGGGWPNRADSANYVLKEGFGTVRHEVLHLMGNPDEYRAEQKPFSQLGEHNSIMNNSNSLNSRIYPRHVDNILDVLKCDSVGGEGNI